MSEYVGGPWKSDTLHGLGVDLVLFDKYKHETPRNTQQDIISLMTYLRLPKAGFEVKIPYFFLNLISALKKMEFVYVKILEPSGAWNP